MDEGLSLARVGASCVAKKRGLAVGRPDVLIFIVPESYSMGEQTIHHQ